MTTMAIKTGRRPALRVSFWDRITLRLRNWGRKIKSFGQWIWRKLVRGASWLYHTKAVQWTVDKTTFAAQWAWDWLKSPVGFVTVPLAAMFFAPKAVAIMLGLVLVGVVVLGYLAFKTYRYVRDVAPEDLAAIVQQVNRPFGAATDMMIDLPLDPNETIDTRYDYLMEVNNHANDEGDEDTFSETTARMYLLEVRKGLDVKLKKNASAHAVHRENRRQLEKRLSDFPWNWGLMHNATLSEDKRLRDTAALKAHEEKLAHA